MQNVKMTGSFWQHYQDVVANSVIPYQWKALNDQLPDTEPSHAIKNFRIAAGELDEEYYGMVFQDSDLYKWLEAVAYSLQSHPNPQLEKDADEVISLLGRAQNKDGYLHTYYQVKEGLEQRWTNVRDNHELYCAGHLIEAAVTYYESTGKSELLQTACKFADYIDSVFGPEEEQIKGFPGHEEIELALVRLYLVTKENRYLNLATFFVNERGRQPHYFDLECKQFGRDQQGWWHGNYEYSQSHIPVREQKEAVGHAVRAMYLYTAVADLAELNNDPTLKEAAENLWHSVVREKLFINGGIGASAWGEAFAGAFDLPNDTTYNETCASIGLAFWAKRMLQLETKGEYADILENAVYNGSLCGMDIKGERFFYVNPLEVNGESSCHRRDHKHVLPERQKWFNCACCPPNLARIIGSIGDYFYTQKGETFYVNLYGDSIAKLDWNGQEVEFVQHTMYPWDGAIAFTINPSNSVEGNLAFRIPGWAEGEFNITINGENAAGEELVSNGYLIIKRNWEKGDQVSLLFPTKAKAIYTNTKVEENTGKVAFTRGPLVYCFEEVDNGDNLSTIFIGDTSIKEVKNSNLLNDAVYLQLTGSRLQDHSDDLYSFKKPYLEAFTLTAIPYFMWGNRGKGEMKVWVKQQI
ncbi:beta-L-arabinofuranosidase domain-containing protein [Niallia alba]|uniref:glycoside hydrolase family 127 protein n=1 Tax=Niallia alba TaxID=2729105 RepID=UPI00399F389F